MMETFPTYFSFFLFLTFYLIILPSNKAYLYNKEDASAEINKEKLFNEVEQLLDLNRVIRGQDEKPIPQPSADYQHQSQIIPDENEDSLTIPDKPDIPRLINNWPESDLNLGQVTAVSVNSALQPVIFHRGDRIWNQFSFNESHYYQQIPYGPIKEHTVLTLDIQTGKILGQWGANLFYMPHGLTVDRHDNLWLTDVALHQAYKFKPGELEPSLIFGERFIPGTDSKHLCKPTSIAVATTGEIFIADGYCNSRILKYNAAGGLLRIIPNPPEFLSLQIPHSLALIEPMDRLCIADRENMRVVCPRAGLYRIQGRKEPALTIQQPDMGRVFAVATKGKLIYAINGPTNSMVPIQGLTIDPETETVIDHWQPETGFTNPHDIAVCANGSTLYVAEIGPNKIWKFQLVPPK